MRHPLSTRPILRPAHLILAVALAIATGCAAPGASAERSLEPFAEGTRPPSTAADPTATELRYIRQTASTIYRGRSMERTRTFLPSDGDGYRLCVRARQGAKLDHTLFTLQRRIGEDFISQAADDVLIDRSSAGTAVCREPRNTWISFR